MGRLRSLPRTVGELDAESLSQIMGRRVTSVSVIGADAGTSSRARLALTGDGVPVSMFVKMPAETVATRLMGELGRLAQTEVLFYRELSAQLTGLPAAYGSAHGDAHNRQACERDLLAVYRQALAAGGGPDLDPDELWLRYRQGSLYAYVAPLITAGMGGMQAESIAMEGVKRGVAALTDLETVAALKQSLP